MEKRHPLLSEQILEFLCELSLIAWIITRVTVTFEQYRFQHGIIYQGYLCQHDYRRS